MSLTVEAVSGRLDRRRFYGVVGQVYRPYPCHRVTEGEIVRWLVEGRSLFCRHATVTPFLLKREGAVVGRFALIHDRRLPDCVQVAFFEALPGLDGVVDAILHEARASHRSCPKIVFGLNGHLNYGCGYLVSRFDAVPVVGLPYTPPYYLAYFRGLKTREMVSYRFASEPFFRLRRAMEDRLRRGGLRTRLMDMHSLAREVEVYTRLNNLCFRNHPYWSHRTAAEDYELFHGYRRSLRNENLIFAELDGEPVGFLLWYPDFNELVGPGRELGRAAALRYRLRNPIRTARLTEIAVRSDCRSAWAVAALKMRMAESLEERGYPFTEGGFIFTDNTPCMRSIIAYLRRATGGEVQPYRRYCLFEGRL